MTLEIFGWLQPLTPHPPHRTRLLSNWFDFQEAVIAKSPCDIEFKGQSSYGVVLAAMLLKWPLKYLAYFNPWHPATQNSPSFQLIWLSRSSYCKESLWHWVQRSKFLWSSSCCYASQMTLEIFGILQPLTPCHTELTFFPTDLTFKKQLLQRVPVTLSSKVQVPIE